MAQLDSFTPRRQGATAMSTPGPAANDKPGTRQGAGAPVARRYSAVAEASPSPPPGRWPRVRRLVAWVGGALVILTAVGTAAIVVRENHAFAAPHVHSILAVPGPRGVREKLLRRPPPPGG